MTYHVRADGSVVQLVKYDPVSGAVLSSSNPQGYNATSTWSRAEAWALYGFTTAYRYTHDVRFLDTAHRLADFYLTHLPVDFVPYWDFDDPNIPLAPRDSSSAAIAASGLTELSLLELDPARAASDLSGARSIITSLSSGYLSEGTTNPAVLQHGTDNKPQHRGIDAGLSWGDYYLLEALLRQRLIAPSTPALTVVGATSSSSDLGHPAGNAVDGDSSTYWSATGGGQWLQLELATQTVHKVAIAWSGGDSSSTRFEIDTSKDGLAWKTAFTGVSSGTLSGLETYDIPDRTVGYVRIVGLGSTTAVTEAAVY
jgi:unsaturated chondroitin disaccharide hydrolase